MRSNTTARWRQHLGNCKRSTDNLRVDGLILRHSIIRFFFIWQVILLRLEISDREHQANVLVAEFPRQGHLVLTENILNLPYSLPFERLEKLRLNCIGGAGFLVLQLL